MFEMHTMAIFMLIGFFVMLMIGVPVAITLATVGFVFGYLGFGPVLFNLLPARVFGVVAGYQWLAIPLFIFMGITLEKSGLADDLLDVIGHVAGGVKGGMAVGIILFGAVFFAFKVSNSSLELQPTQRQKLLATVGALLEAQHYSPKVIDDNFSKKDLMLGAL